MSHAKPVPDRPDRLPIFPLGTVLFPGGVLPLRIFEARYMDMTTRCLRDERVFGVCLIAEGGEVGAPALPHPVGTSARIMSWDMAQAGLLHLVTHGEQRFRIVSTRLERDGLLTAEVLWLPDEPVTPLPEHSAPLVDLLLAMIADVGEGVFAQPHRFEDADWVGMRLASVLPMPDAIRQQLLEMDDPLMRLDVLHRVLASHKISIG